MPETDEIEIPKYPTGLKARGKRLWCELHETADFTDIPEAHLVAEEACYLADEIDRQRRLVRKAGSNTRVKGYNGQEVTMPEVDDLRKNQTILLAMLKALRLPSPEGEDGKLTRSEIGKMGAAARWDRSGNSR